METDGSTGVSFSYAESQGFLTTVGSRLFFLSDRKTPRAWDGTKLTTFDAPGGDTDPEFTGFGNQVLFGTPNSLTSTLAGPATTILRRLAFWPSELRVVGERLYFTADEGPSGRELWRSDGTAAGTWQVADIRPGAQNSNPQLLGSTTAGLFLSADDGSSGRELWLHRPSAEAPSAALSIQDVTVTEGNVGATFSVALSAAALSSVSVDYVTADGTGSAQSDYTTISGTLTFAPGEQTKTVTVPVLNDNAFEPSESFVVNLTASVGALVSRGTATATILPDDDTRSTPLWQSFFAVDTLETPMVGDFNGDGRTDVITFTRQNPLAVGDVYVALSNGTGFGSSAKWHDWFAISTDETVLIADFDGDRKDDIATFLAKTTGQVYVALSTGTGIGTERVWLNQLPFTSGDVVLAGDADGDGKKDLIRFARTEGRVWVARSTGAGFAPPTLWHSFFAVSTYERPRVGDVNGDGRADIVTFATDSPTAFGDVYVALSDGVRFGDGQTSSKWHDFFAIRPSEQIRIGDVDGDGKTDFFTFLPPPFGQCYVTVSLGTSLGANTLWREAPVPLSTDVPFVGDVNGDGRVDIIIFAQSEGKVYVSLSP